jgi:hypothetical protein
LKVARRRQSVLRDVLVEMLDRLRPGAFRLDLRGERLLAEVQALEATGGLVPLDGALVGDASEIGAVMREHRVWPAAVAAAFRRAGCEPIIHSQAVHD